MLELLRRHGWNSTSFQIVESDFRSWFDEETDGAVAYVDTRSARVVAGAPIAAADRIGEVAARFVADARRVHQRVAFFAVEHRFIDAIGMHTLKIGLQPFWNPQTWSPRRRSMKEQLRRARAKGLTVRRMTDDEVLRKRSEIERLMQRWLCTRAMPPMTFLVELQPFTFIEERRYYEARAGGALKGLLVAVPIYRRNGWFFQDILRDSDAPNGTAESLVDAAMKDVAVFGATYVTLGLAPLAGDEAWQRSIRRMMSGFYNFDGLLRFKSKLEPAGWDPIYIAWPDGSVIPALIDVLNAFAGGRAISFAFRALLRGPSPVLLILGALAIPWSMLLALPASARWFPSRRVQYTWVAFDLIMAATLISLSRRYRRALGAAAAIGAALDIVGTTAQAARFNVRRARGWRDHAIIAIAIAAPCVVTAVLIARLVER